VQWTPGARLKSVVCDTEVVVVRPPAEPNAVLSCGGQPMVPHAEQVDRRGTIAEGHEGGTMLGKRYGHDDDPIEVLVTKAGAGALSLDGVLLTVKQAKPLPSSD
jgi:hypothetical protein